MSDYIKINKFLKRLLFVPHCAGCGARLSPIAREDNLSHGTVCLCQKCMQNWQTAKREACHVCFMPAGECTCTGINRKIKQPFIPSLFFYHQNRSSVQNQVLFSAKTRHDPELFEFLAKELVSSIEKLMAEKGLSLDDCILTWLPRNKRSIRKHGHDQAQLLCLELSKLLNVSAMPLLTRRGGTEQKKLDAKERRENAEASTFLNVRLRGIKHPSDMGIRDIVQDKTIILIDDIITTGASMRRGILLLEPLKPRAILCACVARREIKSK